jgi:Holliday junction DNA helicase RuvA
VDKVGVKKALKALGRPIKEIAEAIQRQDHRWLSTLPGIGQATAEKIVATLRKKVTRYSLLPDASGGDAAGASISSPVLTEVLDALITLGMSPAEARSRLDKYLAAGEPVTSVEEILPKLFQKS